MKTKLLAVVGVLVALLGVFVAVTLLGDGAESPAKVGEPTSAPPSPSRSSVDDPSPRGKLAVAESEPLEDSIYPHVGDPGVDSLHHDLQLAWDPESSTLEGTDTLTFRATATAGQFQLDLGEPLEVTGATLDGEPVETSHVGKDLVVAAPVREDRRYVLQISYSGTPEPAKAPTTRSDFSHTGWTITEEGEVWTMQEPYGAYTWYPVNDHPSDKALYDFTITAPSGWVGVANGELTSREDREDGTVTTWHLDSPAASYLVTIAIGDFVMTEDESESGVPITYWTPRGNQRALRAMRFTPEAIAWLEERLGPYPFSTLGSVVVDSNSAMETQTMPTYGTTDYTLSRPVVLHELTHQWYGDLVSPTDWTDVWMNEGMTMLLQGQWEAEQQGRSVEELMDEWAPFEPGMRAQSGPPGDYDPRTFGEGNIYYGPALMWNELRKKIGDERFWAMVRAWPSVHSHGNATREEYLAWVEKETGEELTAFFDAWLLARQTPPRS